jgi:hypothetical protein
MEAEVNDVEQVGSRARDRPARDGAEDRNRNALDRRLREEEIADRGVRGVGEVLELLEVGCASLRSQAGRRGRRSASLPGSSPSARTPIAASSAARRPASCAGLPGRQVVLLHRFQSTSRAGARTSGCSQSRGLGDRPRSSCPVRARVGVSSRAVVAPRGGGAPKAEIEQHLRPNRSCAPPGCAGRARTAVNQAAPTEAPTPAGA